ncbi:MAG TPA: histidine kinase [Clostridiales bacterium]|nr:histidine kinase [Clostridiales bacterium]
MKKRKNYSQNMYLFIVYGFFIMILLTAFFSYFYRYNKNMLYEEARRKSEDLCSSIGSSVNTELNNMSTVSMNILYSNAIKSNFIEFSNTYRYSQVSLDNILDSRDRIIAIYDIVTAIIGPFQTVPQVNLYSMGGDCVGSGYFQRVTNTDFDTLPWYKPTMDLNGHKYISSPQVYLDLPGQGENQVSRKYISLTRLFFNEAHDPQGIIEVIQDCNQLFSLIPELKKNNPYVSFYVYNDRGELLYPYYREENNDYLSLIKKYQTGPSTDEMISYTDENNEEHLVNFKYINDYDWTVITSEPKDSIYFSINSFKESFTYILILSILLTLAICFFISNRLTRPLRKLTNATKKITINRVLDEKKQILTSADSNIEEISQLCESIREMYGKLRSTTQDVLLSRSEETRAKLQATQSLINPHFLYNCLTNISVMAEEDMNEDIVTLCQALCDYFRYISSSEDMIVPLSEELFSTEQYIKCMEMRYKEAFEYSIDVEETVHDILIPKLILLPIVENAFKYAFEKMPPWKLNIKVRLVNNYWTIAIQDNGGCLSNERKEYLMNSFNNIDINEESKSLKIGGMGLKNVYLRLKLLYGKQSIFEIENTLPQRTIFTLGGPIYKSKEEYYEHNPKL